MTCSWCGSLQGVRLAEVHIQRPASICGERSPFDPRQHCVLERGHLSACRPDRPSTPTPLCFLCFGIYVETGERPAGLRLSTPAPGPITGAVLDLGRLR